MEENEYLNSLKNRNQQLLLLCIILFLVCGFLAWVLIKSDTTVAQTDFGTIILSILLNLVTVGVVFIANYYFVVREKNDYEKYKESLMYEPIRNDLSKMIVALNQRDENMYEPIKNDLDKMLSGLQTLNAGLVGLEKVMYSNDDPPWDDLLREAKSVDLCLFYVSDSWRNKYDTAFKAFCKNGGVLNVYLPNPNKIKSRYVEQSIIDRSTRNLIISTFFYFKNLSETKDNVTVKMLEQGLNYVFARIEYTKKELFYLSPYSNSTSNGNLPKFLFNSELPKELKSFFDKEKEFLKEKSDNFIDIEKEKYIIWREDRNTVYLSTGLVCNNMCRFCYSSSLIEDENQTNDPDYIAQIICKLIDIDPRFRRDTTVMLGGFNDPFHEAHYESTLSILEKLKHLENPVHIATRIPLNPEQISKFPLFKKLVINYSISTFPSSNIHFPLEPYNQEKRFHTAKQLIDRGGSVALFIRPVIKDRTIGDLDLILKSTVDAGISVITVGGLYYDDKIETSLSDSNVSLDKTDDRKKEFVLDVNKQNKLMKNGENETKLIISKIKEFKTRNRENIQVFENARERVRYFNNIYMNKKK